MKKNQNFLSENFHFLVVKFSVDLNRHVFVMSWAHIAEGTFPHAAAHFVVISLVWRKKPYIHSS